MKTKALVSRTTNRPSRGYPRNGRFVLCSPFSPDGKNGYKAIKYFIK